MSEYNVTVRQIMKLHRCADCPIHCHAQKKPKSLLARIHRWHRIWWPGWQIYLEDLRLSAAGTRLVTE
jgi:hypothetical protein